MLGFLGPLMGGIGKGLGKVFGKGSKLDPTQMALGGLSALFGGDDGPPPLNSFHKGVDSGAARLVDPIQALYNAINASNNLGVGLNNRLQQGVNLRSSYVQPGPAPVSIPGLGFQIGGGLGTDPAFKDPSLLNLPFEGDLFGNMIDAKGDQNFQYSKGASPVPKRRTV